MVISSTIAQEIIKEVASVISTSINLMDGRGKIIASTNPLRIGTIHNGAVQILQNNLPELFVHDEDSTNNVRPGLNLPIVIENKVVGVVGLTGKFEEVAHIGRIVQKMTEVLLRQELAKKKRETENLYWDHFLDLLLLGDEQNRETTDLASVLGFDLSNPKSLVLFTSHGKQANEIVNPERWADLCRLFNSILQPFTKQAYFRDSQWVMFLPFTDKNLILEKLLPAIEMFLLQTRVHLRFGVSALEDNHFSFQRAYLQGQKALSIARIHSLEYFIYDSSSIEIIASNVEEKAKIDFLKQLFRRIDEDRMSDQIQVIKAYFKNNGSITKCAKELFIHPNTLQYKLKNLQLQTGYDIRRTKDSTVFQMAILFYDFLNPPI